MRQQILALGCCGLALLVGPATFAQSSGPALRVVPMGEAPPAKKAPAKKAPTPAAKATAPKPPATKAAVATRPATTPTVSGAVKLAAKPVAAVSPSAATAVKPAASAAAAPAPATTAKVAFPAEDWRVLNPENALIYETTKGRIIVELAPEMAPGHVARVKMLAREGFYNGLSFHRVVSDFMAQGGDPKGDGTGGSDQPDLRGEFNFRRGAVSNFVRAVDRGGATIGWMGTIPVTSQTDLLMERTSDKKVAAWGNHCLGVASMARGNDENSANSQFFLMRAAYPTLDRRYSIWGRAVVGTDVIRAFKVGEPVVDPDKMISVRVLADVPEADRPTVMVQRTDGPSFQAKLKATLEQRGAAFSNCDLAPEGRIAR
ncbi:MAG: peptidylprolyl isomerase [Aquidulcibacter sp.]|uniref:peptidylprolyl isomerase n=1 Tax=Aquidulcibacter sp. TaxID=2052990 RepID=UPI0022BF34D5|nr:peptidylprolyl isomerase [Aquidulcibacter sp.]